MFKLRIIHCLRAPVGGLFRHVRDLAKAQRAAGHQVGAICDSNANDSLTAPRLEAFAETLDLGLHFVPMARSLAPSDATAVAAIRRIVRESSPAVVHGHGAKGGAYARLATIAPFQTASDTPLAFYTPHGGSLHFAPTSLKGRIFMALERYLARHTAGIIFESAFARGIYARNIGQVAAPIRVIPNGLTKGEFRGHTPPPDAHDVLFVGELRTLKGVDVLLNALSACNADKATTALIVGEGPDGDAFKGLSQDLGLDDVVTFAGAMPAAEAFDRARCIAVPSRAESLPYIVLEAAAACVPLIATDVGGIPEIVSESDTHLIPCDNADALAEEIRNTLADPTAARARAARLQARIAQRFTVGHMSKDVLAFYADALAARKAKKAGQTRGSRAVAGAAHQR